MENAIIEFITYLDAVPYILGFALASVVILTALSKRV